MRTLSRLKSGNKVIPIFIFDTEIIHKLPKEDARIEMIHAALGNLTDAMKRNRCTVGTYHGKPKAVFESLLQRYSIKKVVANHDYEPYALKRDQEITSLLEKNGIAFETHKDKSYLKKMKWLKTMAIHTRYIHPIHENG